MIFLKGNVSIPQRLATPIRPLHTPNRLLIRLPNGSLSTTIFDPQTNGSTSTSASTESSSTSSSYNKGLYVSKTLQRYSNPNYQDFVDTTERHINSTNTTTNDSNQNGTKQHSLSDDHLHLYAQRESNVRIFL